MTPPIDFDSDGSCFGCQEDRPVGTLARRVQLDPGALVIPNLEIKGPVVCNVRLSLCAGCLSEALAFVVDRTLGLLS